MTEEQRETIERLESAIVVLFGTMIGETVELPKPGTEHDLVARMRACTEEIESINS